MAKKKKTKAQKLLKRARREASPARTLLLGALGAAVMAYFNRDRLEAGLESLRDQADRQPQPAE
jgi:hypothetical protein